MSQGKAFLVHAVAVDAAVEVGVVVAVVVVAVVEADVVVVVPAAAAAIARRHHRYCRRSYDVKDVQMPSI